MRFLFTAAPHDRIKHLRVSSTPSGNAETLKKQHSSGKSSWGGQNQEVKCVYSELLCLANNSMHYEV